MNDDPRFSKLTADHPTEWMEPDATNYGAPKRVELRFYPDEWKDNKPALYVTTIHHSENGTPEAIWHGRVLAWSLPHNADAVATISTLHELTADFDAIANGHTVEWNGSNHVGHLTQDASDRADYLAQFFSDALPEAEGGVSDAGDWFIDGPADIIEEHGLTAQTTDAELYAIANKLDEEAKHDHSVILSGTYDYLRDQRQNLIWQAEDNNEPTYDTP